MHVPRALTIQCKKQNCIKNWYIGFYIDFVGTVCGGSDSVSLKQSEI